MTDGNGLLVVRNSFQLGTFTGGDGCYPWTFTEGAGMSYRGVQVSDQDVPLPNVGGNRATLDVNGPRVWSTELTNVEAHQTEAEAEQACDDIEAAFSASGTTTRYLHWINARGQRVYLVGRPRGVSIGDERIAEGIVTAVALFSSGDGIVRRWVP